MTVGGPEDALHHYEVALELLGDPHVAAGVVIDPGRARPGHARVRANMAAAAAGHPYRAIALQRRMSWRCFPPTHRSSPAFG